MVATVYRRCPRQCEWHIVINNFSAIFGTYLWMTPEQLVENLKVWPEPELSRYLATEVRRLRQDAGESQRDFAERAGIPLRTYKRFETHGHGSLETFLRAIKTAGRSQYLFLIFPSRKPLKLRPPRTPLLRPGRFSE